MTAKCIITGCRLVFPQEGRHIWGDLHEIYSPSAYSGLVFVFNAGGCPEMHDSPPNDEKQIIVSGPGYMQIDKIFVIPFNPGYVYLTQAARDYIRNHSALRALW